MHTGRAVRSCSHVSWAFQLLPQNRSNKIRRKRGTSCAAWEIALTCDKQMLTEEIRSIFSLEPAQHVQLSGWTWHHSLHWDATNIAECEVLNPGCLKQGNRRLQPPSWCVGICRGLGEEWGRCGAEPRHSLSPAAVRDALCYHLFRSPCSVLYLAGKFTISCEFPLC